LLRRAQHFPEHPSIFRCFIHSFDLQIIIQFPAGDRCSSTVNRAIFICLAWLLSSFYHHAPTPTLLSSPITLIALIFFFLLAYGARRPAAAFRSLPLGWELGDLPGTYWHPFFPSHPSPCLTSFLPIPLLLPAATFPSPLAPPLFRCLGGVRGAAHQRPAGGPGGTKNSNDSSGGDPPQLKSAQFPLPMSSRG
jgi:hypothetical protein